MRADEQHTDIARADPPRYALPLVALIASAPILYVAWGLAATMLRYDYGIFDMDWNSDGWVTPGEVVQSLGVGTTGPRAFCREYYSLKDGLPIRRECPADK